MNNSRSAVTYRNAEGVIIPAPKSVWQPRKGHETPGEDDFVLLNTRARRRLANRGATAAQRKARKAYVRKEIDRQNAATDLAQFFNIIDGLVPSRLMVRVRTRVMLADRVKAVVDADQARYDREIAARQADRTLPAPTPPLRHEDVEKQLRAIAKTATTYAPKVKRDPSLTYPISQREALAMLAQSRLA